MLAVVYNKNQKDEWGDACGVCAKKWMALFFSHSVPPERRIYAAPASFHQAKGKDGDLGRERAVLLRQVDIAESKRPKDTKLGVR